MKRIKNRRLQLRIERALARLAADGHQRLASRRGFDYTRSPVRVPKGTVLRLIDEERGGRADS